MPQPKRIMCECGKEIALCTTCGFRPVEFETTDGHCLCATCAQDSHLPCGHCGDVVPVIDMAHDMEACMDCRRKEAALLITGGETGQFRRRGMIELDVVGAEMILVHMLESGQVGVNGIKVEDALRGVRRLLICASNGDF